LSLAVALGKLQITGTTSTLHPPSNEYPQTFPVAGGTLEVTAADATIGYLLLVSIPGHSVPGNRRVELTVDLSVGTSIKPFYLVVPPVQGPPILQAFGVADVMLRGSSNETAIADRAFLEHREGATGLFGTPIVRQQLTLKSSLALEARTWWVYVGVLAHLEAQRWFTLPPPPPIDRSGFVGIDLRVPQHGTHSVHDLLEPNGPVTVRRIELNVCTEPVFA
jgi:hypothetical protein